MYYLWSHRSILRSVLAREIPLEVKVYQDLCNVKKPLYLAGILLACTVEILCLCASFLSARGSDQISIKTPEQAWDSCSWHPLFYSVASTMVSGHRGRQRDCWCQDQGPWPCHGITNTLSLCWGERERLQEALLRNKYRVIMRSHGNIDMTMALTPFHRESSWKHTHLCSSPFAVVFSQIYSCTQSVCIYIYKYIHKNAIYIGEPY